MVVCSGKYRKKTQIKNTQIK